VDVVTSQRAASHTCMYLLCSLLASGSDDVQVIIWDPFRKKQLTTIRTGHNGNIFSVKVCLLAEFHRIFSEYMQ